MCKRDGHTAAAAAGAAACGKPPVGMSLEVDNVLMGPDKALATGHLVRGDHMPCGCVKCNGGVYTLL
jgi:hypothetical protein